ncbi:hypothetical protein V6N11_001823 [Hibiscus sabdariffa]|uniref:DUF4283 domain-containing protein n=1 Tax=Hibiscus sabdariffa TaxID=183260 RepID=A0ABR2QTJ2_9ROSI
MSVETECWDQIDDRVDLWVQDRCYKICCEGDIDESNSIAEKDANAVGNDKVVGIEEAADQKQWCAKENQVPEVKGNDQVRDGIEENVATDETQEGTITRRNSRFNPRSKFWKKTSLKSQQENDSEFVTKELNTSVVHGVQTIVAGISDKAVLERLCSSVIVSTFKPYKVETLFEFLEGKGLIEFDVHQISGNQYLLDFDREEMVSQCLKWEWGWLSEIFSDINRWHKDFSPGNRVTWVAIQGVPLFAWNNFTFNNLLNRWSEILFLEDEQLQGRDFSIKRAKILTKHMEFIEERWMLVLGRLLFRKPLDFQLEKAGALYPMRAVKNTSVETLNVEASTEVDLVCCVERSFNIGQNRSAHRLDFFEVPLSWGGGVTSFGTCINDINLTSCFKVDCAKDHNSRMVSDGLHSSGQFQKLAANVHGFGGSVSVQNPPVSNEEAVNLSLSTPLEVERYDSTIEFWKRGDVVGAQPVLSSRALEDVRLMGLIDAVPGEECEIVQCDTTCPN